MNSPTPTSTYEVVEMERTAHVGPGARILFGLISRSLNSPPLAAKIDTTPTPPKPIFCLCYEKGSRGNRGSWELSIDKHYNPETINAVASNGAHMGLRDLVKKAKTYATTTHPNG